MDQGLSKAEQAGDRRRERNQTVISRTSRLELGTKVLLFCGLFWIIGGGFVALYVGLRQIEHGNFLYGFGSVMVGAIVLFSAWFMRRELTQD